MNLGRMFASAVVRRVVYVLVALAFCALGVSESHAAICGLPDRVEWMAAAGAGQTYTHQGTAHAACLSATGEFVEMVSGTRYIFQGNGNCVPTGTGNKQFYHHATQKGWFNASCARTNQTGSFTSGGQGWTWTTAGCPDGEPYNSTTGQCGDGCETDDPPYGPADSNQGSGAVPGIGEARICHEDCAYSDGSNGCDGFLGRVIDGSAWVHCNAWQPTGSACSVGTPGAGPAPTDSDGDGTSDPNDSSPNNPGSGGNGDTGSGGEGEDPDCGGAGQPACGEPGSGSGNGNTSGGGGDCSSPPHSSGDAILAQIAFQAWATRCAVEGQANAGNGDGDGDGDGDGEQPEWTEGNGPPLGENTDQADIDGAKRFGLGVSTDLIDEENIFGEGSCPNISFTIWGHVASTSDVPAWCTIVDIMRAVVLLMGAFTALQILLGRV